MQTSPAQSAAGKVARLEIRVAFVRLINLRRCVKLLPRLKDVGEVQLELTSWPVISVRVFLLLLCAVRFLFGFFGFSVALFLFFSHNQFLLEVPFKSQLIQKATQTIGSVHFHHVWSVLLLPSLFSKQKTPAHHNWGVYRRYFSFLSFVETLFEDYRSQLTANVVKIKSPTNTAATAA